MWYQIKFYRREWKEIKWRIKRKGREKRRAFCPWRI